MCVCERFHMQMYTYRCRTTSYGFQAVARPGSPNRRLPAGTRFPTAETCQNSEFSTCRSEFARWICSLGTQMYPKLQT